VLPYRQKGAAARQCGSPRESYWFTNCLRMQKRKVKDGEIVSIHGFGVAALVGGASNAQVSPSGLTAVSSRLLAEADSWCYFRVRSLKFRLHNSGSANDFAIGFVGGAQDTLPATLATVMELLPSTYFSHNYTRPSDWVVVSGSELAGPFPWYKSVNGTADTSEEGPGYICIAGTTTQTFYYELYAVFEFKTAVAPANTPLARQAVQAVVAERRELALRRERDVLLRALASAPPAASPKQPWVPTECLGPSAQPVAPGL